MNSSSSGRVSENLYMITARAPVNIAVIKYWGKTNEDLILPTNDSLSATLGIEQLCAQTTAALGKSFKEDRMWLNGKEVDVNSRRVQNCLKEIRLRAAAKSKHDGGDQEKPFATWKVHICSKNNFPTAAGLASSAAGYACLVYTLGKLFQLDGDLSAVARRGSGSACRSLHGGFVQWVKGEKEDGSDSKAKQIVPESHWPEMRILILVASDQKKQTASTSGMEQSIKTSKLLQYRAASVVPERMNLITEAILKKDFHTFAEITMQDSNQLHAVCLDTYPPIRYMNNISWSIIDMVHRYNDFYGTNKVAYSFDAGPNACLFLLEDTVPEVIGLIKHCFPSSSEDSNFVKGLPVTTAPVPQVLLDNVSSTSQIDSLLYVIHTKVGSGPIQLQDSSEHLLSNEGLPVVN